MTSVCINTFWVHITWEGNRGRDNKGDIWIRKNGWAIHESGIWKVNL